MNKTAAEIIAGIIPNKLLRNQWRGKLRYGIINSFRLKRKLKRVKTPPEHYLSICAIAKNEGPYFKEWLDWHIEHGVDKFYIFDNESTDSTKEVLEPYIESGIVEYTFVEGIGKQLEVYDLCLEKHRFDSRWIAFIDIDEFIVPVKHKTIPDYLRNLENFSVVEINWLVYGSGGERKRTPGNVMERFRYHSLSSHILNRHVKSIIDPRRVYNMIGCHEAARIKGKTVDSHGDPVTVNFRDREPQHDIIKINHYAIKSYEEFKQKQARGRARGKKRFRGDEYFEKYDLNDIKDS